MGEYADLFDETPQANLALRFGIETNPDQAAEAAKLARRYRLPIGVVKEFREDYQAKAKADDAKLVVDQSPLLKSWIAKDQQNADISHDDVGNLSAVASAVREAAWAGRTLLSGIPAFSAGAYGLLETTAGVLEQAVGVQDGPISGTLRQVRENQQAFTEQVAGPMASDAGVIRRGIRSGIQSVGQQAPGLAASIVTGNPMFSLAGAGLVTTGQSATKAMDAGLPAAQALVFGAADGAIEVATEKLPVARLLGDLAAGTPFLKTLVKQAALEVPGEQLATIGQDFNEWATLHPDKPFKDFIAERPAAAVETLVATLVGTGIQTGAAHALNKAANSAQGRVDIAETAAQDNESLKRLDALAKASKVRERDAVTFEQFIEHATEDGPVQDVFISGEVLLQSGLLNQLAQVSPAIAEQAQTAAATGGDVRIPIAEYAARIAGTDLSAPLLDHLKTSANGLSQAEAKEYIKDQGERLKSEVETALGDTESMAGRDAVQTKVLDKLNAIKRFTPDVNTLYAQQMANFFAIQAKRTNTTPEALFAQFEPRIVAESVTGDTLSQQARSLKVVSPGDMVDGRMVRGDVPNIGSIGASLDNYTVLDGIREIPMDAFDTEYVDGVRGKKLDERTQRLADEIGASGELNPLIVAFDSEGAYIVEGGHRFDALIASGAKSLPAVVVIDEDSPPRDQLNQASDAQPQAAETQSLAAISKTDEMFALPKSSKDSVAGIAADNNPAIKVRREELSRHESMWILTMPDGTEAFITMRQPNKDAIYGADFNKETRAYTMDATRPGKGAESIDPKTEDVWIDVSRLKEGSGGSVVYNIAATFAHNTGRIFIGDPSGVSAAAMKRRPENMLSSALKFGTTRHLAPHPDQVRGKDGVPPLDWVYGDDIGNVRKLIDLTLKIQENAGNGLLDFDPQTGRFTDREGRDVDVGAVSPPERGGRARPGHAGNRTLARNAVFRALLREQGGEGKAADGGGRGLLERLVGVASQLASPIFYQGGVKPNATFSPDTRTIALLKGANLSSFLHEAGHFYLEVLTELARANPVIRQDMDAVLKWFGITGSESVGKPGDGAPLEQSEQIDAETGLPLNPDGTVTVYHHTDARSAEAIKKSGRLKSAAEPDVYLTTRSETDTGYGDTAVAVRVKPELLRLDDEFPNGRRDFRISTTRPGGSVPVLLNQGGPEAEPGPLPSGRTPFETWELMTLDERRPFHEKFARGFEAFLFEGKSPSPEMQGTFARFRAWMVSVYKSIKALNVELTDEVRGVFDRMLASPEQIEAAQASREMGLMFATEEEARKFGIDWAAYQAKGQKATDQAVAELDKKSLADMQWLSNAKSRILKEMQKRNDGLRKEVEREVRSEVMARPVYRAWTLLTAKEGDEVRGADDAEAVAVGRAKLNTEELKERYGIASDADWRRLSAMRMTSPDGVSPDSLSEQIGFTSGDEMVKALIDAVPPQEVIKAETDQQMLERYGDITSDEALAKAVDDAVHNDMRQRVVADELAALEKAESAKESAGVDKRGRQRSVRTLPKAAKEFAQNLIAGIKIRDLRPAQYATAAGRAGVMAMRALKKNDIAEAAKQKRNQLVQGYASKAASKAQDEVSDGLDYLRKVDKSQSIDQDYKDQIDTILERFDLKRGTSLKTVDKRKALSEWIAQQEEIGISPDLPPEVTNEALRKSYKDMTVEEFRGLVDSIKQIEHLGRLKKRLLTAKDKRDFEAARDELVASIQSNAKTKVDNRTRDTLMSGAIRLFKGYFASHRKTASLAKELDGFKDGGPMWEYLIRTMNEAGDTEAVMREKATVKLTQLLKPILKTGKLTGKGQFFASVGLSLNRGERLVMALNSGNAGNLQRLLDGRGWTMQQVQPILDSLTEQEADVVQQVWDFFESYRPLIAEKERRVMGKEPDWVEPQPVMIGGKQLKGGYYPIKYDPRESGRAENFANAEQAKQELKGAFVASTTRRSFTKSRAEEVSGRPLLLTMGAIFSGANEVIHDLSWHEWVIDANRILRNDQIDKAIRDGYGADTMANLKQAVKDIAAGEAAQADALSRVLSPLRAGATIAGLGLNLTNAMLQPLGLTQSMVRVGSRWVSLGIAEWAKSPVGLVKQVHEKSDFMRLRAKTQQRELNEIASVVKGKSLARAKLDALMFMPMTSMQLVADMPTWWGAYQKALAGGNQEERSIELADQAVIDAQGGGQVKDLSAIQRGGPLLKLFTTFYGYFNVAYNLGVERTKATNFRDPLDVMHLAWDFLLLYSAPAVLATLVKEGLTGGGDDEEKLAQKVIDEQISFLMGTMVGLREVTGAMQYAVGTKQFDMAYGGPAGLRFIQELDKLGKQIGQGELDRALVRAGINVAGVVLHLPSGQVNKTIDGVIAISEGKTENPSAILFGPPKD